MGHWHCSQCRRRFSSPSQRPVVTDTPALWPHYVQVFGRVTKRDELCRKCYAKVRKFMGFGKSQPGQLLSSTPDNTNQHEVSDPEQSSQLSPASNHSSQLPLESDGGTQRSNTESYVSAIDGTQSANSESFFSALNSQESVCFSSLNSQQSGGSLSMHSNSQSIQSSSSIATRSHNSLRYLPGIQTATATEKQCFLCGDKNGRVRVSQGNLAYVWKEKRILIPKNNRCCLQHLDRGKFTKQALDLIAPAKSYANISAEETSSWIHALTDEISRKNIPVDFAIESSLCTQDYELLVGLNRSNFDNLFEYCESKLRNSSNRSKRNALGMFLMKLTLDLSQRVLGLLFGISNLSSVSESLDSIASALASEFVPKFLGYSHLSRQELLANHTMGSYSKLLGVEDDRILLILDGTYLYIQKPTDFALQRKTYSLHKHRNLVKPMMIVTSTGYILETEGIYGADGQNNDSNILNKMMTKTEDSILDFLDIGDVLCLDRGFRDVISEVEDHAIYTHMPQLLKKNQKQFSTPEANKSRQVTMVRWIVESVNGRIKNKFGFFDAVIQNTYIPKINILFRIACAIINAYSPPLVTDSEFHENQVKEALSRIDSTNQLQTLVQDSGMITKRAIWEEADADMVTTFPTLTEEDLKTLTLGVYQIKMARLYAAQHVSSTGRFQIFLHKESEEMIRAKIQSRFSRVNHHSLWIQFLPDGSGATAITSWYCMCKTGARTVGMCSHVASVLWFLGFSRHHPESVPKTRNLGAGILNAAAELAHESEEEEEEDDEKENS